MPHCFVKQPNGLFAIWSSVVDHFITVDCTHGEAIDEELKDPRYEHYPTGPDGLLFDLFKEFRNIAETGRAWKWAPTWKEACERIRELHGDDAVAELLGMLEAECAECNHGQHRD